MRIIAGSMILPQTEEELPLLVGRFQEETA
jgi:hypothetical protein